MTLNCSLRSQFKNSEGLGRWIGGLKACWISLQTQVRIIRASGKLDFVMCTLCWYKVDIGESLEICSPASLVYTAVNERVRLKQGGRCASCLLTSTTHYGMCTCPPAHPTHTCPSVTLAEVYEVGQGGYNHRSGEYNWINLLGIAPHSPENNPSGSSAVLLADNTRFHL